MKEQVKDVREKHHAFLHCKSGTALALRLQTQHATQMRI